MVDVSRADAKSPRPKSPLFAVAAVGAVGTGFAPNPANAGFSCAVEVPPRPAKPVDFAAPELDAEGLLLPKALCPKADPEPNALPIPVVPNGDVEAPPVVEGCPKAAAPNANPVVEAAGLCPKAPKPRPADEVDNAPNAEGLAGFADWPNGDAPNAGVGIVVGVVDA